MENRIAIRKWFSDGEQRMLRTLQNYRVILGEADETMTSLISN